MKDNKIILVLSIMLAWSAVVVLAAPAAATENRLLLDPADCVTTGDPVEVVIYTDINETYQAAAASFDIEYDPNCVKDFPGFDATGSGWVAGGGAVTCTNPASGILRFTTMVGMNPAISGHVKVGTLTLICSTTSCESFLNFTDAAYTTGNLVKVYPAVDNGVFSCTSTSDDGRENDGGGKSSGGITAIPSPTPSPGPTTSSNPMPTSIPAASPTSTPATTSNPASAPENENGEKSAAPGFGLIISGGMIIAAVYLIRKRGGR